MAAPPSLVLTCEHGGARVPRAYAAALRIPDAVLASHRGFDAGALDAARALSRALAAPLVAATTTRLLVDLNRSPHNPRAFSPFARRLPREVREALLRDVHAPHWARVRAALDAAAERAPSVVHVAVHSFTPVLGGDERRFDVGLLYDPRRAPELRFARRLQAALRHVLPGLRVRRNAPYRGVADGLATAMRRERPARRYVGLELELCQAWLARDPKRRLLVKAVELALRSVLAQNA
ncbi:MAG: N-formylglutamate amidohydrolase [Myxococcota bacterium]